MASSSNLPCHLQTTTLSSSSLEEPQLLPLQNDQVILGPGRAKYTITIGNDNSPTSFRRKFYFAQIDPQGRVISSQCIFTVIDFDYSAGVYFLNNRMLVVSLPVPGSVGPLTMLYSFDFIQSNAKSKSKEIVKLNPIKESESYGKKTIIHRLKDNCYVGMRGSKIGDPAFTFGRYVVAYYGKEGYKELADLGCYAYPEVSKNSSYPNTLRNNLYLLPQQHKIISVDANTLICFDTQTFEIRHMPLPVNSLGKSQYRRIASLTRERINFSQLLEDYSPIRSEVPFPASLLAPHFSFILEFQRMMVNENNLPLDLFITTLAYLIPRQNDFDVASSTTTVTSTSSSSSSSETEGSSSRDITQASRHLTLAKWLGILEQELHDVIAGFFWKYRMEERVYLRCKIAQFKQILSDFLDKKRNWKRSAEAKESREGAETLDEFLFSKIEDYKKILQLTNERGRIEALSGYLKNLEMHYPQETSLTRLSLMATTTSPSTAVAREKSVP